MFNTDVISGVVISIPLSVILNKSIIFQGDVLNATYNATDEVNLTNATIVINQSGYNQYYNLPYEQGPYGLADIPVIVPEDSYFVLGDNSGASYDSRFWGFVPKESVMGTVLLIYWPFPRFHVFVRPHPRLNLYLNSTATA